MSEETTTVEEVDANEESSPLEETEETAELEQVSSESSEEESGEENTEEKPKKNRVQQRISDLVQERKQATFEADFYRRQYEDSQKPAPVKEVELEAITPPGLPPDRYNFDDDSTYQAAVGQYQDNTLKYQRHVVRDEMNQEKQNTAQAQAQQRQQTEHQEIATRLQTIEKTGLEKYQDYDEVAFIPQNVAGFVSQFDNAVDIAYHWGKNPTERAEIEQLANTNPTLCAAKIGALDAKLGTPGNKTTKAPPPPKPVGTKGRASTEPDPSKDLAGWTAWRNKQEHGS